MDNKVLIFSAPSGSGKSTIVGHILGIYPDSMEFSVSATSRPPRGEEQNGKEYYFLSTEEFRKLIEEDKLVEYEEVYEGRFYGTLKSECERIWANGHVIIFDVDVKGGVSLKKYFGDAALSIFIQAPSVEVLRERLIKRGTDSLEEIEERVAKATEEMEYAPQFDYVLVNDELKTAFAESEKVVEDFLDDGKLNYSTFI
ncbi:MAG: guanylate kinase [Bacteroidales bacterium]|nr:guanylate kinase [Bacteroidales bacterium]